MKEKKKILVCPLDWGLGHATRCIPIIQELQKRNCDVRIAASGDALALLRIEFPDLPYSLLTGYQPHYSSSSSLVMPLAFQMPKFIGAIRREHDEINKIVGTEKIDLIISDNRYGCWSPFVTSILITHQLHIRAPGWLSWIINSENHRRIRNFSMCWVPDQEGEHSLAGDLSARPEFPVSYIGTLSRFSEIPGAGKRYEILALISGPEPQRAIFEDHLRAGLKKSGRKALLVRGIPGPADRRAEGSLEEVNHLPAVELNRVVQESEIVFSRSGYSTIMDLARLGKKAIFVPTPGQPEQEYLAKELMKKKIALSLRQDDLDIEKALIDSESFSGFKEIHSDNLLAEALEKVLL